MARPGLRNHPKFRKLVHMLGIPAVYAQAHLQTMWDTCYETGDDRLGDPIDVELCAEWTGEAGKLFDALKACPWIDERGQTWCVHDLYDHCPEYVIRRRDSNCERSKDKACAECGATYHSADSRSRYCSDVCRVRHFRGKQKPLQNETDVSVSVTDGNGLKRIETAFPSPPLPSRTPPIPEKNTESLSTDSCPTEVGRSTHQNGDESIYLAYPRHEGKRKALAEIVKARRIIHKRGNDHPGVWLLERVQAYAKARSELCAVIGGEDRFTPLPATWFHQGRYDDDPAEWAKAHVKTKTQSNGEGKTLEDYLAETGAKP